MKSLCLSGLVAVSLSLLSMTGCGDDDDDTTTTGGSSSKGGAGSGGKAAGTGGATGGAAPGTGGSNGGAKAGTGGATGGVGGAKAGAGGSSGGSTGGAAPGDSGAGGMLEAGAAGMGAEAGMGGAAGSGASGGAGGAAGMDGAAGAGGVGAFACTAYCTAIMATCSAGADLQYPSQAQCEATCAVFPTGAAAGNTLECRAAHTALAAAAGVEPHCQHAGPAGVSACGGPCPAYCTLMMTTCSGKFATEAACLTACEGVPGGVPGTVMTDFSVSTSVGNTLGCRIYHATNAAVAATDVSRNSHCGHAAGESICVTQ